MPDANQLQWVGTLLAGNLAIAYIALFIAFAALEALFGKVRDPESAAHGRMIVHN